MAAVAVAVRQSSGLGIGIGTSRLGASSSSASRLSRRGVNISNALAVTVLGGRVIIIVAARRIRAAVLVAVVFKALLEGLVVVKRVLGLGGGSGTARGARARGSLRASMVPTGDGQTASPHVSAAPPAPGRTT